MSSPQSPRTPDAVDKAWESDPGRSSCGVFRKAVYVAYLKNTSIPMIDAATVGGAGNLCHTYSLMTLGKLELIFIEPIFFLGLTCLAFSANQNTELNLSHNVIEM